MPKHFKVPERPLSHGEILNQQRPRRTIICFLGSEAAIKKRRQLKEQSNA